MIYFLIFFMVTKLILGQFCDCLTVCEVTLDGLDENGKYQITKNNES